MIQKLSLSLIWIMALLSGLFFIDDLQLELFAGSVVLTFIWAVISLSKSNNWQIPSSWVLKIMTVFWLLAFVSVLKSDILSVSLMAFCLFSVMPLTFFVFIIKPSEESFIYTAKAMGVVYTVLSVSALAQFFIFGEYFGGRASYPLANPNSLAALLSLGFFCCVGLLLGTDRKLYRNLALALAMLLFGGIVVAASRGALYALVPTLLIFLFCVRDVVKEHARCLGILLVGCLVLFFLTSVGVVENESLFYRIASESQAESFNGFTNNRFNLWLATIAMIKAYGLFGTGIGTYFLYFPEFRLSDDIFGTYYAHNDPLQYWVELGILGPLLFYGFIIAVAGRTVQAVRQCGTLHQKLLILTPFFALCAAMIHSHVTFNLYNLSILFVIGFLLSVWFHATQNILQSKMSRVVFLEQYSGVVRKAVIALPFLLIGALFMAYVMGEHYTNKARQHLLAGELEEFASDVILAQRVGFNGNYRAYLLAVTVPLSLLEEADNTLTVGQKEELTRSAWGYIEHVRYINPRSSSALYYMGRLVDLGVQSALSKETQPAEFYYMAALKIDPLHIGSRLALAQIYDRAGDKLRALDILEKGAAYKYSTINAVEIYQKLAEYYLYSGKTQKRNEALQKAYGFQKGMSARIEKKHQSLSDHIWRD